MSMLSKIGNVAKVFCICTLLLNNLTGFYLIKTIIEKDSVSNIHCLVLTSFEMLDILYGVIQIKHWGM